MNNKGQTLVIFVIILPILLIMLTLIVDLGFMYIEKRNIENNVSDSLEYYLVNIAEDDIDVVINGEGCSAFSGVVNSYFDGDVEDCDKLLYVYI